MHQANVDRKEMRMFARFVRAQKAASDEARALADFAGSIGRDFRFLRWPYRRQMREPREHASWRRAASLVTRFSLAFAAGIIHPGELSFYEELHHQAVERARAAWARWIEKKKRIEADFLRGRRRKLPWLC